ncbi:MAG: hypothetical protein KKC75_00870 [Nanoarchaeota archaeon]|nr:hypothetical protein [Nanoarchaeota archaeon]MBU1005667.1 hypothetical protein [Nanoarchaeota archaeon]MBU1946908.1 hypothetical protein [Nanoarchaeota archaeon]
MDKTETALGVLRKILTDEVDSDSPDVFKKYIDSLDRGGLLESVEMFGTPQYILNTDDLRKRARFFIDTFKEHIPNLDAFYAFKCNDFPFLIKILKEDGFKADVAGLFELQLALKLGFDRIIFTGPGKSIEELQLSLENSDKVIINIDNKDEFLRLKSLNPSKKVNVSIRINPDTKVTQTWSKFGIELIGLKDFVDMIRKEKNINLIGLHFHCSWNETSERYVKNISLIGDYLKKNFSDSELSWLEFFDIGGGFYPEDAAVLSKLSDKYDLLNMVEDEFSVSDIDPYTFSIEKVEPLKKFAKEISESLNKNIFSINPKIKIYCEPGRFIATHSTSVLLKVIAEKDGCVIVDGGINMFGDYRFEEYAFAPIVNLSNFSSELKRKIIYGPLCDPSDLWGYSYYGNEVKKGDVLAVLHQGAYTFCCAWRFIKPIPSYIVLEGKNLYIGKEQEGFEQRYSGCKF